MIVLAGPTKIPLPKKFLASGINSGVRRYRPDVGVIISEVPAIAAAVFTQNTCKAAPVQYSQSILPSRDIQAIVTNSGEANAATGEQGHQDNLHMVNAVARHLKCNPENVLSASTGVIGKPMQIDKICKAIPELINTAGYSADKFALSILTTDLVPKWCVKTVSLSTGDINITGICKGSGMIHPNMATMLGYLVTDAKLNCEQANSLLKESVNVSFNMISVDGESSTNDTVFLLSNGASSVAPETEEDMQLLEQAFKEVSIHLAKSIVSDGEGSSKFLEVDIQQAPSKQFASQLARSLTQSPLIKTAMFGESPNWGRIIARMGMEEVPSEILDQCDIAFQSFIVYQNGKPAEYNSAALSNAMRENQISININLKAGQHNATAWGCDLTDNYVKINADYLT